MSKKKVAETMLQRALEFDSINEEAMFQRAAFADITERCDLTSAVASYFARVRPAAEFAALLDNSAPATRAEEAHNHAVAYLKDNLQERLYRAAAQLMYESIIVAFGEPIHATLLYDFERATAERGRPTELNSLLLRGSGGARKKQRREFFRWPEEFVMYARTVDELRPLWKFITDYIEESNYEADSIVDMRRSPAFIELSKVCGSIPDQLMRDALRKKSKSDVKYSPTGLALRHAFLSLDVDEKEPSFRTLRSCYDKGKKHIEERSY